MRMLIRWAALAALASLFAIGVPPVRAQAPATPPDLSGVYYPFQPPAGGAGRGRRAGGPRAAGRQDAPPLPTRSAPLEDGSAGRAPTAPKLTPPTWRNGRRSENCACRDCPIHPRVRCIHPGCRA